MVIPVYFWFVKIAWPESVPDLFALEFNTWGNHFRAAPKIYQHFYPKRSVAISSVEPQKTNWYWGCKAAPPLSREPNLSPSRKWSLRAIALGRVPSLSRRQRPRLSLSLRLQRVAPKVLESENGIEGLKKAYFLTGVTPQHPSSLNRWGRGCLFFGSDVRLGGLVVGTWWLHRCPKLSFGSSAH